MVIFSKCNTCKFWDQNPKTDGRWKNASVLGYGNCKHKKIKAGENSSEDFKGSTDMLVSSDSEGEYEPIIRTGMDFGCIHHNEK